MKKAFTHAGRFHADDVFSAALLTMIYPDIKIERGFQVPENYDGIVFDIGFGEFDHHQTDGRVRENGIPYAAFGLLWEKYGTELLSEESAKRFDEKFVMPLDESDNTGIKNEIAEIIGSFNPSWDEASNPDECFDRAKELAIKILERKFVYLRDEEKADQIIEEAMKKAEDHIMILECFVPWKKKVIGSDVFFVVFPSQRGGYHAQAVPKSEESTELLYSFPSEWCGKEPEELADISGIETLSFCHNSGFLIAAQKQEDVILACKYVMGENNEV